MSGSRHVVAFASLAVVTVTGCAYAASSAPEPPTAAWDHLPRSDRWTSATIAALDSHGAPLVETVPADVEDWCPAYPDADETERKAFWTGLLSTLAELESTWNPEAVGGGGRWFGLVQISPRTAQAYDCRATSADELMNGPANLSCAVRIAADNVTDETTVTAGMGDWGPFKSASKSARMANFTRTQDYCGD